MITLPDTTTDWQKLAAQTIASGGIVLHPTDTAYGLAVDATNAEAIRKVFALKKRKDKPLIIVVRDIEQAAEYTHLTTKSKRLMPRSSVGWEMSSETKSEGVYVELDDTARLLAQQFWPGALTLVLPKKEVVPNDLTSGSPKVGIRQPNHPVTQALSRVFPRPYTSTSANLSGGPTPYTVPDALAQLDEELIDLVIDAGPLPVRPTSTVVDPTTNPPQILREGGVKTSDILKMLS